MKLVELECQNCGAALKIEKGTDIIKCPYCNASYKLDEEKSNMEKEKNNIQNNKVNSKEVTNAVKIAIIVVAVIMMSFTILSIIIFGVIGSSYGKKHYSKYEISSFNSSYSNGRKAAIFIENMLNKAITTNKTNKEKDITVKYKDIETKDPEEILEIENQLNRYREYDVLLDYDKDGFVCKITIK